MEIVTPGDPGKLKGQLNMKFLGTFKTTKGHSNNNQHIKLFMYDKYQKKIERWH